ncbi:glucokinase [Candidatus Dependentiae bacterium]|nr:glucokinase [Candidatus Dependentiae bacterium]
MIQLPFREDVYVENIVYDPNGKYFLAGDIGGTNTNFGIFRLDSQPVLLFSIHYKSQDITDFPQVVNTVCQYVQENYKITLNIGCFGAAGIVKENHQYSQPTNLPWPLSVPDIKRASCLKELILINDFEAVGYGIDFLSSDKFAVINTGIEHAKSNKACIGAGTGLGKALMRWSSSYKKYVTIPTEGGHADFVVHNQNELELVKFIQKDLQMPCNVSWEHVLSGKGIQRIYKFLIILKKYPKNEYTAEIEAYDFNPDRISFYAQKDELCRETFLWYSKFYARCAKNYTLDTLALAGIYIGGGIAAKNLPIFQEPHFLNEFRLCGKYSKLLSTIPIYIILDYNVSLYGALGAYNYYQSEMMRNGRN